jgi:hypothetical protein
MTWYVASLLFEATHSQPSLEEEIWEERHVLLSADTVESARQMASAIAAGPSVSYVGQDKDQVEWRFRQIERIYEIEQAELRSGVEIFSRFLKATEAKSLLTKFQDAAE